MRLASIHKVNQIFQGEKMTMLNGKKTYLVVVAMVLYGVLGVLLGKVELNTAIMDVLTGLGIASIRHGIKKVE